MDGQHTHGSSGDSLGILALLVGGGVVVILAVPMLIALIHALIMLLLCVAGLAVASAATVVGYRLKHPQTKPVLWSPAQSALRQAQSRTALPASNAMPTAREIAEELYKVHREHNSGI